MTQFELRGLVYTELDTNCFNQENRDQLETLMTDLVIIHRASVFDTSAIKETLKEILNKLPQNVTRVEYNSRIRESNLSERREFNPDLYESPISLTFSAEQPGSSSLAMFIYDMAGAKEV